MPRSALSVWLVTTVGCASVSAAATASAQETTTISAAFVTMQTAAGDARPGEVLPLPFHWDAAQPGRDGVAEIAFDFSPVGDAQGGAYALFISYIANAYEIELNGAELSALGRVDAFGDRVAAKKPALVSFPARLLLDSNHVVIRLRCDARRRGGLSQIVAGPLRSIKRLDDRAELRRVIPTQAAAIISLLVSGFCFLLWLQQRDTYFAWAGVAEAIWAITVGDTVFDYEFLPWPAWSVFIAQLRMIWIWALYRVTTGVFDARPRFERLAMLAGVLLGSACVVTSVVIRSSAPVDYWRAAMTLFWLLLVGSLFNEIGRAPTSERITIAIGVLLILLAGFHDAGLATLSATMYDERSWVGYAGTGVALSILWVVSRRFRQARLEVIRLNESLAERVTQKEIELRDSFVRLSEAERARAILAERERILRDMHDGVGANLATAMRQLESGDTSTRDVAQTLRESLDQLKLSIDAMNSPAGDVNALLASLRYRLQPRIENAGLHLEWDVDELPHWQAGDEHAMRNLRFLLLEAISNALQHASASRLRLGAHVGNHSIEISLDDNGRGLQGTPGRGLKSMRDRAIAIGAEIGIEDAQPGTRVRVSLALPKA